MTVWRIDAPGQTIALTTEGAVPRVIWWGPTLPADEDLAGLARAQVADLTGGMLDRLPDLTLCPLQATDWQGQPGLVAADCLRPWRALQLPGLSRHRAGADRGRNPVDPKL